MLGSSNLTGTKDAQRLTEPGMAFFADTGPVGKTCGECKFKGYWRTLISKSGFPIGSKRSGGCAKFHALTGTHGPAIDKNLRACKYFEPVSA
jgi:hypothetical protein